MNDGELIENLAKLNNLKKELKDLPYQTELKMNAAFWWDLQSDAYFNFDYSAWSDVRSTYYWQIDQFHDNFKEICEYNKVNYNIYKSLPIGSIKNLYFNWKNRTLGEK